eukprot:6183460-Pleurochrysis_carterae.AAC.4
MMSSTRRPGVAAALKVRYNLRPMTNSWLLFVHVSPASSSFVLVLLSFHFSPSPVYTMHVHGLLAYMTSHTNTYCILHCPPLPLRPALNSAIASLRPKS